MNPSLSVKSLFDPKIISDRSLSDKKPTRADSEKDTDDFGKILKQHDQQKKSSKRPENFSSSDKKSESNEEKVTDVSDEFSDENPSQEVLPYETNTDEITPVFVEIDSEVEDCNGWFSEANESFRVKISENDLQTEEEVSDEGTAKLPEMNCFVPNTEVMQVQKLVAEVMESEDVPEIAPQKIDLPVAEKKPEPEVIAEKAPVVPVMDEFPLAVEVRTGDLKGTQKAIPFVRPNDVKIPLAIPTPHVPSFEAPQTVGNVLNLQHLEVWNNIGTKSASKGGDRKGGIVSSGSIGLVEIGTPLHRDTAVLSSGSKVAEILSQKAEVVSSNLPPSFENQEVVLPQVQPKVAVNTYETVQQEQIENVQGMIATLEQQMDEMKRVRRNSVIVKVDLENGESLNCQVTLARSDVAIHFPALEETFKMQILNHWESLRKFAQTRQLNLAEPHFIEQTAL